MCTRSLQWTRYTHTHSHGGKGWQGCFIRWKIRTTSIARTLFFPYRHRSLSSTLHPFPLSPPFAPTHRAGPLRTTKTAKWCSDRLKFAPNKQHYELMKAECFMLCLAFCIYWMNSVKSTSEVCVSVCYGVGWLLNGCRNKQTESSGK